MTSIEQVHRSTCHHPDFAGGVLEKLEIGQVDKTDVSVAN